MKTKKRTSYSKVIFSFIAVLGLAGLQFLPTQMAAAAQITNRSLTLQAIGNNGGSMPGGVVSHLFKFTVPTTGTLGSIKFLYCTTAGNVTDPCTTPTGLSTTAATLGSETGSAVTGFTMVNTTNGAPYLTRTAASVTGPANVVLRLDNITNPTASNTTFFVRMATYASTDTTGTLTDSGTVAFSTANPIVLTGTMPESLVFCTGATIGLTANVPDCTTATSGAIGFSQLFSPTSTSTAQSQMSASTNAGAGYAITVNGTTLTSGSNTIAPMAATALGAHGVSQFGLNLVANTTTTSNPTVGSNISVASNGTNFRGEPTTSYNTPDQFKYSNGDVVADSSYGGTAGGTDAQIYTVSYIVNVPGSQPAGTYTSTLTYICTPTF